MTTRKFANHPASAAHIISFENGAVHLVSYSTTVIEIDPEGWMTVTGLYSRTTIRHIGWFMKEFGLTYQHAKEAYLNHEQFNVYTGEIIPGV